MRKSDEAGQGLTLAEVKSTVDDLLIRAAGSNITESGLFPHGVTHVSVRVAVGEIEISVEISGPDHSHPFPLEDGHWPEEDEEELFTDENGP
jgi:hypothetical protein